MRLYECNIYITITSNATNSEIFNFNYLFNFMVIIHRIKPSNHNEDHILIMWAVAFYIVENYQEEISEEDFSQKVYQVCILNCNIKL